jgi:peptidoglycan L-alanyl-D-glutamate endopeptidase CwlK
MGQEIKMSFKFSERSLNRMDGVDPRLQKVALRAIEISRVDFGIPEHGGIRTAEEQNSLYKEGKSKADGYDKQSYHQTGKALDVYAYINGSASWEPEHLAMVAAAMLQAAAELGYPVQWGGLWKSFQDMPHFQLP